MGTAYMVWGNLAAVGVAAVGVLVVGEGSNWRAWG